ncbi:DNA (cytosine-5-)-methyltransferase [Staphylococcus saprophyticus]|nr:DNA (cytosine-5-)-methyltransferase [Staphylococcus saprophyticus]
MNFIDICSGIGGFRSALEMNGHNCLAFAEIDKYAKQSYRAIYDTEGEDELDDITAITDEHFRLYRGQCDIITGGFPCQAFSIAGNRRGFDDTRGTIFFHIARAIKEIQPSYVLLENVKGLFSHDKGRTFGTIIQALDELGYVTEWGLFNSKYWGVPQNRERVYILVTRKDKFKGPVLFDLLKQQTEVTTRLVDVLEDEVDEKYYLSEEKTKKLTLDTDLGGKLNMYDYNERDKVHSVNKVSPTLNTMQGGDRQPKIAVREATKQGYAIAEQGDSVNVSYPTSKTRRGRVGKQVAQTLQAGEVNQGVVMNDIRIRKLVPIETWRLQGFSDEQFYKAKDSGVSNSQLYKQAGNSVSVPVVDAIVKCL